MFLAVTFLTLFSFNLFGSTNPVASNTCVPNAKFLKNSNQLCSCNEHGTYEENNCKYVGRRLACQPGHILWQGCRQCTCQSNGQFTCSSAACKEVPRNKPAAVVPKTIVRHKPGITSTWCTPFRSYYVNCSICVCPASGRLSEAHCVPDSFCSVQMSPYSTEFASTLNKNVCIPKVMYLFPCMHCLCSDNGSFVLKECMETCQKTTTIVPVRKCIPSTLYRKDCNICVCPLNGIQANKSCSNIDCSKTGKAQRFRQVGIEATKCKPHTFTKPRCIYCDCNTLGVVNEQSCLEIDCLKTYDNTYAMSKETCSPGEIVPSCIECFCLANGYTNMNYCSKACSFDLKLTILENVLKDSVINKQLINKRALSKLQQDTCAPGSVYMDNNRYCICPDNGITSFKICTTGINESTQVKSTNILDHIKKVSIDFNATCQPSSFVQFDCNTCFCTKNGTIDPKWCTYDDCDAKNIIQKSHKTAVYAEDLDANDTCTPGAISKVDCNICICPDSGTLKDRVCTKTMCTEKFRAMAANSHLICEPLAYYEVDCNICVCPQDGMKNLNQCTKIQCEKSYLRSDMCMPGELFTMECNVCVCPLNGQKSDKVCVNRTCTGADTWDRIFQLTQNLAVKTTTRNLEYCFPGDEYLDGCKICSCPDIGLKSYATCVPSTCNETNTTNSTDVIKANVTAERRQKVGNSTRHRLPGGEEVDCSVFNFNVPHQDCSPGSIYYLKCKECHCPYMGTVHAFCRPLPKEMYCEQPYPNFNYIPNAGSRREEENATSTATNSTIQPPRKLIIVRHWHTNWPCPKPGTIMDKCFICQCEGDVVVEEHCFKSNATECENARPLFFGKRRLLV